MFKYPILIFFSLLIMTDKRKIYFCWTRLKQYGMKQEWHFIFAIHHQTDFHPWGVKWTNSYRCVAIWKIIRKNKRLIEASKKKYLHMYGAFAAMCVELIHTSTLLTVVTQWGFNKEMMPIRRWTITCKRCNPSWSIYAFYILLQV